MERAYPLTLLMILHVTNGDPPVGCTCYVPPVSESSSVTCGTIGCSVGNDDGNCLDGYNINGNNKDYRSCTCPDFNIPAMSTITIPNITTPTFTFSTITMPNMTTPTFTTPTFTVLNITVPIKYYSTCSSFCSHVADDSLNISADAATACCSYLVLVGLRLFPLLIVLLLRL